jgi:hypothetical protein
LYEEAEKLSKERSKLYEWLYRRSLWKN